LSPTLTAGSTAFGEGENLIMVLIATGLFAWYEGRRIDSYFMPIGQALSVRTWEGVLAGIVIAGGVGLGMVLLGGMHIHGLALSGRALLTFALAWLLAMVLVAIAEELWFRAYSSRPCGRRSASGPRASSSQRSSPPFTTSSNRAKMCGT